MSANSIGNNLVLTSFGESHGPAVGCVLDGFPAGFKVDIDKIQFQLNRRRPGQSNLTTQRKEEDQFQILSGIYEGKTLGTPITLVIANKDSNPKDYDNLKNNYRPGHADVLWQTKMGHRDHRGGGRSSARITASWVAAGALAEQFLSELDEEPIKITAWVQQVHHVSSDLSEKIPSREDIDKSIVRCPNPEVSLKMEEAILQAKEEGDSLGGSIRVAIQGIKAGLGSPIFRKLNAILSYYMLNINAVKGIYFGDDSETHKRKGSENNDTWTREDGEIKTLTNHAGGIVGGMSSGSDILFEVFFKPTSSISKEQQTINSMGESVSLKVDGRHDPCVLPRAVPIVESMCALAIMDLILDKNQPNE